MTPLSKRLIIALAISGALNLLCVGLFVGGAIRRHRMHDERAQGGPGFRGPRGEGGPRLGRREGGPAGERAGRRGDGPFGGVLAGHREEMMARHRATSDARRAVEQSLAHEPFDPAALEHSLRALRGETVTTQELLHKTLFEAARDGDAETRKKLAHGFERVGPQPL